MGTYDLWGPFLYFMFFASINSLFSKEHATSVFTTIFCVLCIGSLVLTINGKLMNAKLGFLQMISILGYSLVPLLIASIFCLIFQWSKILDLVFCVLGCLWSIRCSARLVSCRAPEDKKLLVSLPVYLYQIALMWMILRVL